MLIIAHEETLKGQCVEIRSIQTKLSSCYTGKITSFRDYLLQQIPTQTRRCLRFDAIVSPRRKKAIFYIMWHEQALLCASICMCERYPASNPEGGLHRGPHRHGNSDESADFCLSATYYWDIRLNHNRHLWRCDTATLSLSCKCNQGEMISSDPSRKPVSHSNL